MPVQGEPITSSPRPKPGLYTLNADGGMVEGRAAIGVVLKDADNSLVEAVSEPIDGALDHQEAEFRALIRGLQLARQYGVDKIRVFLDSELVVNTVDGDWNLHPPHLQGLLLEARALFGQFADGKVCWVPREMNTEADLLASRALPPKRLRD